jgi:hypothetical protein
LENLLLNDVIRELIVLDLICQDEKINLDIAIFGGSSLLLHLGDDLFRSTRDIDYTIDAFSSEEKLKKIMDMMPGYFHNLGGHPEFPDKELYKDNGIEYQEWEGIQFKNLKFFLPSIEMIALSKLMSKREKDLEDLKNTPIINECDLIKLKEFIDDCETYLFNTVEYNFHEWDDILMIRGLSQSQS